MADEYKGRSEMNRRDMLKKGAAGAGAFGFAPTSITWESADSDEFERLRAAPEVQSILSELKLDSLPEKAEKTELKVTESTTYSATRIEIDFGTLYFGDFGGETSAGFEFSGSNYRNIRSEKYRKIPSSVDAWLIGLDNDTIFIRTATDEEKSPILSQIPVNESDDTSVYTGSNISGFRVDVVQRPPELNEGLRTNKSQIGLEAIQDTELKTYHVNAGVSNCSTESVPVSSLHISADDVSVERITTQGIVDDVTDLFGDLGAVAGDCGNPIIGCISAIGVSIFGCGRCVPVCASSPTGVGAVLCIGCVYLFCDWLLSGIACVGPGGAMDCLETHGYV
ncbi:hypothetical protein Halru_0107 [Halovivax ruber XH-70]|uniref:Uncharacterized protein n=1 Tax=Halovivax ruber (strain DSM 18193 / JCM 13892 / XH-70) TaxID=797302 RepID=L0I7T6_HALRX|nr:hypothetical protein [Halovivax ruber]AGB14759.1 hypothetical protein Halru_0107 [Halovivax ruber XH-70]